ncbi:MAG: hypothetical protein ACKVKP_15015, partial [Acidimicrobiales bacterium]
LCRVKREVAMNSGWMDPQLQSILKIFHPLATLAPARVIQRILTPRILLVGWLNDSSSNLVN